MCAFTPKTEEAAPKLGALLPLEKKFKSPLKTKPPKIILIAGPTACGKTDLSLLLAEMLKGEIVSADSMQVYCGMDIGTAKVPLEVREQIPHHLIDIRHIQESFNVVDFYYEAKQCIDSILARDRVPIVVGGTGFYLRALLYGPPSGPPSIPAVRDALEEEMNIRGNDVMYEKLRAFDPTYAATITPNDKQKIIRALEIITLTGEKVSSHTWEQRTLLPDYAYHPWFIHRPRSTLYPLINERCEHMLQAGLLDEVRTLAGQGLSTNPSASQAIGYKQCLDYLETPQTTDDYEHFVATFKTASRHYAKRQFTWFRKEPIFHWLDVELHDLETAAEMIAIEYNAAL